MANKQPGGRSSARLGSASRLYSQLRRILAEVDLLAPYRVGLRADELMDKLRDAGIDVRIETVRRDLRVLRELGCVSMQQAQGKGCIPVARWTLNLKETAMLQRVAIQVDARGKQ